MGAARLKSLVFAHHAFTPGIDGRLCAVGQMKFAENVGDMALDSVLADNQVIGYLRI
jgi:hypothetical protein